MMNPSRKYPQRITPRGRSRIIDGNPPARTYEEERLASAVAAYFRRCNGSSEYNKEYVIGDLMEKYNLTRAELHEAIRRYKPRETSV